MSSIHDSPKNIQILQSSDRISKSQNLPGENATSISNHNIHTKQWDMLSHTMQKEAYENGTADEISAAVREERMDSAIEAPTPEVSPVKLDADFMRSSFPSNGFSTAANTKPDQGPSISQSDNQTTTSTTNSVISSSIGSSAKKKSGADYPVWIPCPWNRLMYLPNEDVLRPEQKHSSTPSQQYFRLRLMNFYHGNGGSHATSSASKQDVNVLKTIAFMHVYYNGLVCTRAALESHHNRIGRHRSRSRTGSFHKQQFNSKSDGSSLPVSHCNSEYVFGIFQQEDLDENVHATPSQSKEMGDDSHDSISHDSNTKQPNRIQIWFLNDKMENVAYSSVDCSVFDRDAAHRTKRTFDIHVFGQTGQGKSISQKDQNPKCRPHLEWEAMTRSQVKTYFCRRDGIAQHEYASPATPSLQGNKRKSHSPLFASPSPHYLPFLISPRGSSFQIKFNLSSLIRHWNLFFGSDVYIMLYSKKRHVIVGQINHFARIMQYTTNVPHKIPSQNASNSSTPIDYEFLDDEEKLRMKFLTALDVGGVEELGNPFDPQQTCVDQSLCLLVVFSQRASLHDDMTENMTSLPHAHSVPTPDSDTMSISSSRTLPTSMADAKSSLRIDTSRANASNARPRPSTPSAAAAFLSPKRRPSPTARKLIHTVSRTHSSSSPSLLSFSNGSTKSIPRIPPTLEQASSIHSQSFTSPKRGLFSPSFSQHTPPTPTSVKSESSAVGTHSLSSQHQSLGQSVAFSLLPLFDSDSKEFLSNGQHSFRVYKGSPGVGPWRKLTTSQPGSSLSQNGKMSPSFSEQQNSLHSYSQHHASHFYHQSHSSSSQTEDFRSPSNSNYPIIEQYIKTSNLVCELKLEAYFQHSDIVQDVNICKILSHTEDKNSMDDVLINIVQSNGHIIDHLNNDSELWRHIGPTLKSLTALFSLSQQYARYSNYDAKGRVVRSLVTHFCSITQFVMRSPYAACRIDFRQGVKEFLSIDFLEQFFRVQMSNLQAMPPSLSNDSSSNLLSSDSINHLKIMAYVASIFSERIDTSYSWYFKTVTAALDTLNNFFAQHADSGYLNSSLDAQMDSLLEIIHNLLTSCYTLSLRSDSLERSVKQLFSHLAHLIEKKNADLTNSTRRKLLLLIGHAFEMSNGISVHSLVPQYALRFSSSTEMEHSPEQLKLQKTILPHCTSLIQLQLPYFEANEFTHILYPLRSIFDTFVSRKIPQHVQDTLHEPASLMHMDFAAELFPLFEKLTRRIMSEMEQNLTANNLRDLALCMQRFMNLLVLNSDTFCKVLKQFMPQVYETERFFIQYFSVQRLTLLQLLDGKEIPTIGEEAAQYITPVSSSNLSEDYDTLQLILDSCDTVTKVLLFSIEHIFHAFESQSDAWKGFFLCLFECLRLFPHLTKQFSNYYASFEEKFTPSSPNQPSSTNFLDPLFLVEDELWHVLVHILTFDTGAAPILMRTDVCDSFIHLFWNYPSQNISPRMKYNQSRTSRAESSLMLAMWCIVTHNYNSQDYPRAVLNSLVKTVEGVISAKDLAQMTFSNGEMNDCNLSQLSYRMRQCFQSPLQHISHLQTLFPDRALPFWMIEIQRDPLSVNQYKNCMSSFAQDCTRFVDASYWLHMLQHEKRAEASGRNEIGSTAEDADSMGKAQNAHLPVGSSKLSSFLKNPSFAHAFSKSLLTYVKSMEFHLVTSLISLISIALNMKRLSVAQENLCNLMTLHYNLQNWKDLAYCQLLFTILSLESDERTILFEVTNLESLDEDPYYLTQVFADLFVSEGSSLFAVFLDRIGEVKSETPTRIVDSLRTASKYFILAGKATMAHSILLSIRQFYETSLSSGGDATCVENLIDIHKEFVEYYKQQQKGYSLVGVSQRYAIVSIRHRVDVDTPASQTSHDGKTLYTEIEKYHVSQWCSGDYAFQLRHDEDLHEFSLRIQQHFPFATLLMPRDVMPDKPNSCMIKVSAAYNPHKIDLLEAATNVCSSISQLSDCGVEALVSFEPLRHEEPYSGIKSQSFSKQCYSLTLIPKRILPSISRFVPIISSRTVVDPIDQTDAIILWLQSLFYTLKWLKKENRDLNVSGSNDDSCFEELLSEHVLSFILDATRAKDGIIGFSCISSIEQQYQSLHDEQERKAKMKQRKAYVTALKEWKKRSKEDESLPQPQKPNSDNLVPENEQMTQIRQLRRQVEEEILDAYTWLEERHHTEDESVAEGADGGNEEEMIETMFSSERLYRLQKSVSEMLSC